jgi:MFS family permease
MATLKRHRGARGSRQVYPLRYGRGSNNYLLELAPPIERAIYVGFANGVVGLALFASPLGGVIVDWLGFESLFLFSLACSLIAMILSLRLEEPRKRQVMPN